MSTQAVVSSGERPRTNINKDNWLGFVGDVVNFSGEVCFKSMLGSTVISQVTSYLRTVLNSQHRAEVTKAVIKVAVAKINGTVEGDIHASKELVLGRTANVKGKVAAPALIVEEGARFNGSCRRA